MVYVRGIIPSHGRTIQVSEILQFTQIYNIRYTLWLFIRYSGYNIGYMIYIYYIRMFVGSYYYNVGIITDNYGLSRIGVI